MSGNEAQTYSVLSERELQIVELVASGLTNQDIANSLEISKRTVDNHISNILQKTGTGNRVALFRWALNWGKICIDEVNCCKLPEYDANGGDASNGASSVADSSASAQADVVATDANAANGVRGNSIRARNGYSQAS